MHAGLMKARKSWYGALGIYVGNNRTFEYV